MLNKVFLIARLGADPEIRYMPSGEPIATLRVATTRRWKDRNSGERKEETEWHRVTMFGATAKNAETYLKKGSQLHIEGRLRTQKWQDKDGTDRYTTEIVCEHMIMLDGRNNSDTRGQSQATSGQAQSQPKPGAASPASYDDFDDDIPF